MSSVVGPFSGGRWPAFALLPLAYFFIGVIGKPSEQEQ